MQLLTQYFTEKLASFGFPAEDFDIRYSLNYCQGDGMAFYGKLAFNELPELFAKIYAEDKETLEKLPLFKRLISAIHSTENYYSCVTIEKSRQFHLYDHYNTMLLEEIKACDLTLFQYAEREDVSEEWQLLSPLTYVDAESLWDTFMDDLDEYIRDCSKDLANWGYRLIEGTPYESEVVYRFTTKNYNTEVYLKTIDDQLYDEFWCEHFNSFMEFCDSVVEGKTQFACLGASVIESNSETVLGHSDYGVCIFSTKDKTLGGLRRELIRDAIFGARSRAKTLSRQLAKIA